MNKEEIEEIKHSLYHDYSWTSKQIDELDLHINDVIEATEQAINYTRCCETVKGRKDHNIDIAYNGYCTKCTSRENKPI